MQPDCPKCGSRISASEINVATDVAFCKECEEVFALSTLCGSVDPDFDLNAPPEGCWFRLRPNGWQIECCKRSLTSLWMLCAIMFAFVVFIYSLASTDTIQEFVKTPPDHPVEWILYAGLLISTFCILVFVLGSSITMTLCVFGRVTITVQNGSGTLFTGVGSVGLTRRFDWMAVDVIRSRPLFPIVGVSLKDDVRTLLYQPVGIDHMEQKEFVLQALKSLLKQRNLMTTSS